MPSPPPVSQTHTHPSVRIFHSSPTPTPPAVATTESHSPMLANPHLVGGWHDGYNPGSYLTAGLRNFQQPTFHKRGSSGSSVTSGGPPSPLTQNNLYPHIVATSDSTFPSSYDFDYIQTPQTAKSESTIMYPTNAGFNALDMRRIQSMGGDERGTYNLSAQSASTMSHNSPATPHTAYEPDYDTKEQNAYGYPSGATSAYHQSLQDVFPNEFAQQQMAFNQAQQSMQRLNMAPSHHQNTMAERLQAAQNDHLRTGSPTSNPREKSPYRQTSKFMPTPLRQAQQAPATLQKQRTSISPKELMLGEHDIDDSNTSPLFAPDHAQHLFGTQRTPSSLSSFYTPDSSIQIPQQYPFVSQARATSMSTGLQEANPEFPAHLISMESTADEASMPSSQQSLQSKPHIQAAPLSSPTQPQSRPQQQQQQRQHQHQHQHQQQLQSQSAPRAVDTSSDSGTYSCTYHGCHMRFETPAKLQKHKRAGHRHSSPTSSESPNLALRNSQAGPHRCDRINPSTKKPCNSIFSRPYDLTRHEDTIHNIRKQKVRCHLCTEEKTFSRNDALTRHMRVKHPDVDWVGKQKRKAPKNA